ncbi:MAG TPA: class I SAM-dependent methyltransferase [Chloroflexota bacterium]|nr:class I SAM-dependent methyltransferase [Chloroflexota bacterium]
MEPASISGSGWSEADSRRFIEVGQIHTPTRAEIRDTILDLIPAEPDEPFLAVELGVGGGWLSEAILQRFPAARVLALDGSSTMLRETESRLQPFAGRFESRLFRLEDRSWLAEISADVRCFVSSLVIHHLDGLGKRTLYRDLYAHLGDGGAVLIADLVAPSSQRERRCLARWWDAEVERQSLALTGTRAVYQRFLDDHSNWYAYPDPMDMPSTVPEHVLWLAEAGFTGVDVFWLRAGHAVYGGYKNP